MNGKSIAAGGVLAALAGIGVLSAARDATVNAAPETKIGGAKKVVALRSARPEKTEPPMTPQQYIAYQSAIEKTAQMVSDERAQKLAKARGLDILNVTWEDTGRFQGSSVGPNISDMTIQVGARDPRSHDFRVTAMPVIRFPNFSDKTADIDPRDFTLLVGNQAGRPLRRVSLHDFLKTPTAFLSRPYSWKGDNKSLLAPRDSKVLVSAQACFLPVPKSGLATFNPVIFNYQSVSNDPAVLTILVTREGASTTIIDNKRDAFESGSVWGQRLFHNLDGQRTSLTGQRESEFRATNSGDETAPALENDVMETRESGLNMVLLIQVPLKQKNVMRFSPGMSMDAAAAPMMKSATRERSDVENAVIGHGDEEGPFTEIDNLSVERDARFPVRVTVQFYKATSNGVVSEADLQQIKEQIDRVYAQSDSVGSLVTGGDTGRVTEYEGVKVQPADWWESFWRRHEKNTGDTRAQAIAKLRQLLSGDYMARPVSDLYVRDALKQKRS